MNDKNEAIRQRCLEINPEMADEPTLADILLTANEVRPYRRLNCSAVGRFNFWDDRTQTYIPAATWHLRHDSLGQQSMTTIDFLFDLLCGRS